MCNRKRLVFNPNHPIYDKYKDTYIKPVVGPAAELHVAVLIVEGEPGDVDLAGGLEDARRDVGAAPVARHHHVRRVRRVKCVTRTEHWSNRIISLYRLSVQ